ncbi:glutaminyl-peptide cyclotransferase [Crossiella cryophila]|uniref:Glutaminyl-peptide cyclotransferase n=1 Tax=Crossiella cryophila TaxID=43355 RepID=A0A7W7CCY9_9PSEU|nr:glutaminyl-peptide cyclotransferase [Crossiella cryophila]MBB4677239.1 glutaminyl-peptide cyclotransferase [Crossiella cryophila]
MTAKPATPTTSPPARDPEQLEPEIIREYPHDRDAFTQGLEFVNGNLVESTGLVGKSRVRVVELSTGKVIRQVELAPPLYGMGITAVPGFGIWQLTWKDGVAILRDPGHLGEIRRVRYPGQGWGICHDGDRLVTSDGTDRLILRDPRTFESTGELVARMPGGGRVDNLNELECLNGSIWANVWQSKQILRIDLRDGVVTAVADLRRLATIERPVSADDVLNGIAAIPGTNEFLLSGKHFGTTFRIRWRARPS